MACLPLPSAICAALRRNCFWLAIRSDTEAIVHLYEEYGPDCLKDCLNRLHGMFAIAICDLRGSSPKLFLARDQIGYRSHRSSLRRIWPRLPQRLPEPPAWHVCHCHLRFARLFAEIVSGSRSDRIPKPSFISTKNMAPTASKIA